MSLDRRHFLYRSVQGQVPMDRTQCWVNDIKFLLHMIRTHFKVCPSIY